MLSKKKAFEMLRRVSDWRSGLDNRNYREAFTEDPKIICQAYDVVLNANGFTKPLADCRNCSHSDAETFQCQLNVLGKCDKFEQKNQ